MLVEMLVAMAVGAFLLVALASVTSFMLRAHARTAAQAADLEDASRILAALSREIRSAAWIRWSGERPGVIFAGGPGQILFAQDAVSETGFETTDIVRFETLPSDGGTRLMRSVGPLLPSARSPEDLVWSTPQEVYRGRYRLSFAYFAVIDGGEALVDDWTRTDGRPVAVRVSLVSATAVGEGLSLRVPLLIDAEPGCAEKKNASCGGSNDAAEPADAEADGTPVDAEDAEGWARYGR